MLYYKYNWNAGSFELSLFSYNRNILSWWHTLTGEFVYLFLVCGKHKHALSSGISKHQTWKRWHRQLAAHSFRTFCWYDQEYDVDKCFFMKIVVSTKNRGYVLDDQHYEVYMSTQIRDAHVPELPSMRAGHWNLHLHLYLCRTVLHQDNNANYFPILNHTKVRA